MKYTLIPSALVAFALLDHELHFLALIFCAGYACLYKLGEHARKEGKK